MSIAVWQEEYTTGHLQVDREHQELFDLVNGLHQAMMQQCPPSDLELILEQLAIHTIDHFESEEALMQANQYPGYARHKQTHDALKAKVIQLVTRVKQQESSITTDLTQFLAEWLAHHIKGEDQLMIRFFQRQQQHLAVVR